MTTIFRLALDIRLCWHSRGLGFHQRLVDPCSARVAARQLRQALSSFGAAGDVVWHQLLYGFDTDLVP